MNALWRARPAVYSRRAWLVLFALDVLPWPWGEDILSGVFTAKAFIRPGRLRKALAWARAQRADAWRRWRLALSACAHHGRFLARQALVGIRSPEAFGRHVVVTGAEHLAAAPSGAILLGFHLGPPCVSVALRTAGHRVAWMGGGRSSRSWSNDAWQRFVRAVGDIPLTGRRESRGPALHRAHRLLRDGGRLYMMADGGGRDAFRVALPGRSARIRSGWLVLRRQCQVAVLPVLSHLEGRTQVVAIHPPLPPPHPDPAHDLAACRDVLTALLEDYVRRFPEQCYGLAFGPPDAERSGGGPAVPERRPALRGVADGPPTGAAARAIDR
jgi:lauroyl/myristoyl acyltransferase